MSRRTCNPLPDGRGSFARGRRLFIRRGGAAAGLLATLAVLGTLTAVAVVFAPRFGSAGVSSRSNAEPPHERQIVTDQIASLLGSSRSVLAIHQRGPTPYLEAVVWVDDRANAGQVDPMEVAVISHSRVLQTVTWFTLPPALASRFESWDALGTDMLNPAHLTESAFCNRWRAHQDVVPRVIATGISDIDLQELPAERSGAAVLAIELIWPSDSTDSPTETSAHVHVAVRAE